MIGPLSHCVDYASFLILLAILVYSNYILYLCKNSFIRYLKKETESCNLAPAVLEFSTDYGTIEKTPLHIMIITILNK